VSVEGQLRVLNEEVVQWRPLGQRPWIDLVALDVLIELALGSDVATDFEIGTVTTGAPGTNADATFTEVAANLYRLDLTIPRGDAGPTGRSIEMRRGPTTIQWRVAGDPDWLDLIDLADLKGDAGKSAYQDWLDAGNTGTAVDFLATLKGPKGDPGLNGGAAFNRARATITTTELAPGETFMEDVLLGASYRLLRISTDAPARVRVYTTAGKQAADLDRTPTTVPTGDHGLLVDVTTTPTVTSLDLSPVVDGWDAEAQPDGYAPFTITNTGDLALPINVEITYLRTE
jgi:hypothetical protein